MVDQHSLADRQTTVKEIVTEMTRLVSEVRGLLASEEVCLPECVAANFAVGEVGFSRVSKRLL